MSTGNICTWACREYAQMYAKNLRTIFQVKSSSKIYFSECLNSFLIFLPIGKYWVFFRDVFLKGAFVHWSTPPLLCSKKHLLCPASFMNEIFPGDTLIVMSLTCDSQSEAPNSDLFYNVNHGCCSLHIWIFSHAGFLL